MRGFDAFAGVIKSGGKTRRAAKMVILNVDHPDVDEFIWCKSKEEKKAWTLIDAGYDGSFDGEAYKSVFFQNSNNSVRVTDDFMEAVQKDREWHAALVARRQRRSRPSRRATCGVTSPTAAWQCGDPGLQYDTTVNAWHTSSGTARINASNPCSEYMYLDDSACNLASLNLRKFVSAEGSANAGEFDVESFRQRGRDRPSSAQEIIVGNAKYPTERIARQLAPLPAARPRLRQPGRAADVARPALRQRAGARLRGRDHVAHDGLGVPHQRGDRARRDRAVRRLRRRTASRSSASCRSIAARSTRSTPRYVPADHDGRRARRVGSDARRSATSIGYRNGQATVLAPTGTIGFMMDCDTTGIEPDIALIKYKRLVGGGMIKIVNNTITEALAKLGYDEGQAKAIVDYIDAEETIEGAPGLKPEHLPVFDCAFRAANGTRSIHYQGHIRMMAAAQPFISGAISKTVNLPPECTIEDVQDAYMESWKQGLKAVAVYRDGCKRTQPLSTSKTDPGLGKAASAVAGGADRAARRRRCGASCPTSGSR